MKFLLILILSIYVISKIGSFFFKAGVTSQQSRYNPRPTNDGNINAGGKTSKVRKGGNIKGGEYVDYEEVK